MHRRDFLSSAGVTVAVGVNACEGADRGKVPATGSAGDRAAALRQRALQLHREHVVWVMHDHRPIAPDVPLMLKGSVTGKIYNLGLDIDVEQGIAASAARREGWARRTMATLEEAEGAIRADPQHVLLARSVEDILRAKRQGKVAILFGVEGGKLLEGRLELLQTFYDRGLRELQLCWAVPNQIVEEQNLTAFGRQVVRECDRLGIIVSLTHISTPAFFEVLEMTRKPPIVCHGIASIPGWQAADLTDRKLKALASRKGLLGIHFYRSYLGSRPSVERVVEQVDHIANLVGIDTVGLGIDFFPTHGPWRKMQLDQNTREITWAIPHIGEVVRVTEALLARNFPEDDIIKVLGGNFLRVCKAVFGR